MTDTRPVVTDAVFDVSGGPLPADYPSALWDALLHHVPAFGTDTSVGVLPLRTAFSEAGMLLPKRAKLVLRLPAPLADHIDALSGKQLGIGANTLQLGNGKLRPIQAYPTLHAHLVSSAEDEVIFIREVTEALTKMEIVAKLICGMRNTLQTPGRMIGGYSLVIHDLKPEASLRLQYNGLGADRNLGCGIFVPHKAITDLD
jgi:CRISPR-associated protein Cas6